MTIHQKSRSISKRLLFMVGSLCCIPVSAKPAQHDSRIRSNVVAVDFLGDFFNGLTKSLGTVAAANSSITKPELSDNGCLLLAGGRGGGRSFQFTTAGAKGLVVRAGKFIDALGELGGPLSGGQGGSKQEINFEPEERIIQISGRAGRYIDFLSLTTNRERAYSFGGAGGDRSFSYEPPNGKSIAALCGRSGDFIDSIGVIVR